MFVNKEYNNCVVALAQATTYQRLSLRQTMFRILAPLDRSRLAVWRRYDAWILDGTHITWVYIVCIKFSYIRIVSSLVCCENGWRKYILYILMYIPMANPFSYFFEFTIWIDQRFLSAKKYSYVNNSFILYFYEAHIHLRTLCLRCRRPSVCLDKRLSKWVAST